MKPLQRIIDLFIDLTVLTAKIHQLLATRANLQKIESAGVLAPPMTSKLKVPYL